MQNLKEFKGINTTKLRGFLTGLILGDGTIYKGVHKRMFSIKSINKNFIDYIEIVIKNNTPFKYHIKNIKPYIDKNGVHHKEFWELIIHSHPYFNKIYHYFYNDYRHRKVYSKTLSWLNPLGIANWYMSNGYICLVGKTKDYIRSRRIDICTDRYYKEDVELMCNYLRNKYNIHTSIITRNNTYRIRIKNESYEDFINLIKPYIVPSMLYKLYLGYINKPECLSQEAWKYQQYLLSAITLTSNVEG